jgi:hypothetical protein
MGTLLFECPVTKLKAQHVFDDAESAPDRENEYVGIRCHACVRLHFINPKTGKLLGYDHK